MAKKKKSKNGKEKEVRGETSGGRGLLATTAR
jgi:hypothetical protein